MAHPDFRTLLAEALGTVAAPEPDTTTDTRILDATLKVVGEYGERHLTIDAVAASSRVARATIFRRFGSKDALIARLYGRETRTALNELFAHTAGASDAAEAITEGVLYLLAHTSRHPVTSRLARAEPETLVELFRAGDPSGQEVLVLVLAAVAAQHEDDLDRRAFETLADLLVRLLFAELLLAGPPSRGRPRRDAIAGLVRATLQPVAR